MFVFLLRALARPFLCGIGRVIVALFFPSYVELADNVTDVWQ